MTDEMIITQADNGIIVESEEMMQVIEDTHQGEENNANLVRELGKTFHDLLLNTMNAELANRVKVKIEITKAD